MSLTSIHDVGLALAAYLTAQGCPVAVVDGPEPTKTATWGRERIVLEHDLSASASFGGPRGLHVNARHSYSAADPYKITIYVRSVAGAAPFEHRQRAMRVREQVLSGLRYVASINKNRFEPKAGKFTTPEDLTGSERPGGAAYELTFTYELPVRVVTFAGAAVNEASLAALSSTTKVSRAGIADDDNNPNTPSATAETACGA